MVVFWSFRKKAREFDLVHINESTCLVPLILARKWFRKPVVLHARAVLNNNPGKWQTRLVKNVFEKYASKIIAIDETIAASLPVENNVHVVHNSFSIDSLFNKEFEGFSERLSQIPKRKLNIGYIGAIHTNKGVFDLLEAIKLCHEDDLDVSLVIAGNGNRGKRTLFHSFLSRLGINQDKNEEMNKFIADNKLEHYIHALGFSANTKGFYEYIDVICFPTYYNSVGRPVFEAAFFGKPSIVAIADPYTDTFLDGETGLKVNQKSPRDLYQAIKVYYDDPQTLKLMGDKSKDLAYRNFDLGKNVSKVYDIYSSLLKSD
jgi:glycosyltransferase involved in cell wall biosynthesis